ncbi:LysR family transcriptional regulator [Azorhizobium oxalatiphilum]|uniref:LysR family transcriptional regulator n=1 Tax=Azorhizobium oxalatiphilum TaxID=980631 RepID=A0A917BUQ3_9HYPH|nr:LysR family transcriptional regulator [Azorhizobium oxalatiphilum]GGF57518.1 LysR family transcriptional regulator [Azorhizobium oxalatiphilum]
MDFRSLEIFYWASQLESFSKAAERMNTTQPAVSQRIAALEAELHCRLFERSSRSISLTEKGRVLVDYAERFLRLRSSMLDAMASPSAVSGLVRLGVSETIVQTWLARFMERVHATYPNIIIDITVDITPVMRAALLKGELDLAFLLGPMPEADLANVKLCDYPLRFVAAPALDVGTEPLSNRDLLKHPIITYPKSTYPYTYLREVLSIPDLGAPRIFSNSSVSTIVRMTLDRIGMSVIPPAVVAEELAAGKLKVVETELDLPPLSFSASYPMALGGGLAALLATLALEVAREGMAPGIQEP